MINKRVIIFQPSSIHIEVIRPQLDFLINHYDVTVVTTRDIAQADTFSIFKKNKSIRFSLIPVFKGFSGSPQCTRLFRYLALFSLLFRKADYIIFNTLSKRDLYFSRILKKRAELFGIIHNVDKFTGNLLPYLTHFKRIFVLSDEVYNYCLDKNLFDRESNKLFWFIPLLKDLVDFNSDYQIEDMSGPITIAIVGSVSQERRDYNSLWKSLGTIIEDRGDCHTRLKIRLVGRMSKEVEKTIPGEIIPMLEYSTFYLPFEELNRQILSADLIAYLIHPGMTYGSDYNKTKITGTSTILKSVPILPVSSDSFAMDLTYKDIAFYYPESDILSFFNKILDGSITREELNKRRLYINIHDYSFEKQRELYLSSFK
ncbi:hypothetical protein [Oceanispirochaeta sp. M1]|uniref:hypothetical protein n=1 Tax=Oceanispirochaeta sp. M1 TaxID=2283433 RepID=UPI000E099D88|nr:hypothetical protein [Oceanispirochaeta sp. M1]RDG29810.1 hypothetical protein DV872_19705 [Oceanispirochaeta sp. M1]